MNNNNSNIIWLGLILLFLLPTPFGRVLIDMVGGLMIFIFLITIIFSGVIWLSWRNIKSKLKTCEGCGASYFSDLSQCPVCGSQEKLSSDTFDNNVPASSATIDISAETTE